MITAGKLDQAITLYRTIETKSPSGAVLVQLAEPVTTWAELIQSGSGQRESDDRTLTENSYQWRIRWRGNLANGDWLKWRGSFQKITGLNTADVRRQEIIIDADANPKSSPPPIKPEG